jgi:hypothetical protein
MNINQKLTDALNYLKSVKDLILTKIFTDSSKAYSSFIFISNSLDKYDIGSYENDIDINLFDNEFIEIISNLLAYLHSIRYELVFVIDLDLDLSERPKDLNEKRLYILNHLIYITFKLEQHSIQLCNVLILKRVLETMLSFLKDEKFFRQNQYFLENGDLIDSIVINVFSLRLTGDQLRYIWEKLDAVNILLKISQTQKKSRFLALASIAYIANDSYLESLKEIYYLFKIITEKLLVCKSCFEDGDVNRVWSKIYFKGKLIQYKTLHIEMGNSVQVSLVYLLDCLYKLACNPKLKSRIYFELGIKDCLKVFIVDGNTIERIFSLRLLVQLAFSESVRNDLNHDPDLKEFYTTSKFIEDKGIQLLIENLKWVLNPKLTHGGFDHVMILTSSDEVSMSLCIALKEKIEFYGKKVWLRKNDSNLSARLNAIENSSCILICVTEIFRQSLSCQIEAKHAVKANKKIIPLIVQYGFENVKGWLGAIIENKKFINFENNFEKSFLELKNQLGILDTKEISTNKNNPAYDEIAVNKNRNVDDWNELEVKEWFSKNKLKNSLFEYFRPFSGKMLKQMYQMKQTSSDFFFKSLNNIDGVKFNDIVLFSTSLDDLFKNNK